MRHSLTESLQQEAAAIGYDIAISPFSSPEEALGAAKHCKKSPQDLPDVIITDVNFGNDAVLGLVNYLKGKVGVVVLAFNTPSHLLDQLKTKGVSSPQYLDAAYDSSDLLCEKVKTAIETAKTKAREQPDVVVEKAEGKGGLPGQKHHNAFLA